MQFCIPCIFAYIVKIFTTMQFCILCLLNFSQTMQFCISCNFAYIVKIFTTNAILHTMHFCIPLYTHTLFSIVNFFTNIVNFLTHPSRLSQNPLPLLRAYSSKIIPLPLKIKSHSPPNLKKLKTKIPPFNISPHRTHPNILSTP